MRIKLCGDHHPPRQYAIITTARSAKILRSCGSVHGRVDDVVPTRVASRPHSGAACALAESSVFLSAKHENQNPHRDGKKTQAVASGTSHSPDDSRLHPSLPPLPSHSPLSFLPHPPAPSWQLSAPQRGGGPRGGGRELCHWQLLFCAISHRTRTRDSKLVNSDHHLPVGGR